MNRIFDAIDWMLLHHPVISIAAILLLAGSVDSLANLLVPPP